MNIALDTNAYSDFALGNPSRIAVIRAASRVYLPLMALAELRLGFQRGAQSQKNEAALQRFLRSPRVELLVPDTTTTHYYAQLGNQLRQQGTPIPINDLWIAALVVQHGLVLCTSDRHFDHIPQLPTC
ncbi:MAG: type II toxin-antitoxin system VapC family toxin [Planctomycetaceae bacterium]|nr:type II toxin-antitoxin system VapC family toxin [Planctomycetaceae bacterium]